MQKQSEWTQNSVKNLKTIVKIKCSFWKNLERRDELCSPKILDLSTYNSFQVIRISYIMLPKWLIYLDPLIFQWLFSIHSIRWALTVIIYLLPTCFFTNFIFSYYFLFKFSNGILQNIKIVSTPPSPHFRAFSSHVFQTLILLVI